MSLAITEKRPQRRPGGCTGIFFQLLEWNRKLAKSKLFSRKLLPPVRAEKRSAKKFSVEEKMPMAKILLIANENRGGFPCAKKVEIDEDLGNGKRDPGIVARLMGLESMPVFGHEKPRKALDSEFYRDGDNSMSYSRLDQDLCFEVGAQGRHESRPQKMQKTGGFLERSSAPARYTPEVARKGGVSRTRKQQHKLVSPLKSPRLLSMSNQARLLHAATKILEPGLQSRSRSRRRITSMGGLESESLNDSLIGSCRSCGGAVKVSQLRHCLMEPLVAHNATPPSKLSVESKFHGQGRFRDSMERKHHISSDPSKLKNPSKVESSMAGENFVHGPKLHGRRQVGSKDMGGAKRNPSVTSCTSGLKPGSKVSNSSRVRTEANAWEKNMAHKKRSNCNLHSESGGGLNPNFMKQRNIKTDFSQKERGSIDGRAIIHGKADSDGLRRMNSQMKQNLTHFVKEAASVNARDQIQQNCRTFQPERLTLHPRRDKTMMADELSNLLEEKIRELNSLNHDELEVGDAFPRRTTASILKELISSLTPKDSSSGGFVTLPRKREIQSEVSDCMENFQEVIQTSNAASPATAGEHPSPISIFDISFSNESCSGGSFTGSVDAKGVECTLSLDLEYDLLDSPAPVSFFGTVAMSNTKVLLENTLQSSTNSFLLDVSARVSNAVSAGAKLGHSSNHLKKCIFEQLVERLDSRYKHLCLRGYKLWLKPSSLFKDKLVEEIYEEIQRWMDLAGKPLDELIEQDLSCSAIRWTTCEAEAFETGMEIENMILQFLVDELVMDSFV